MALLCVMAFAARCPLPGRSGSGQATVLAAVVVGGRAPSGAGVLPAGGAVVEAGGGDNLLVFGAGVLGRRVAAEWQRLHPEARVVGVTAGRAAHAELRALGIEPVTAKDLAASQAPELFRHVVFCAPPGRAGGAAPGSYAAAVAHAISHWGNASISGIQRGRNFVFTSSAGVFYEDGGGTVDEMSQVSTSPRDAELSAAEAHALQAGGIVLRLAGLYETHRGAHTYWLKTGVVQGTPKKLINLVHYDDAAAAVVAALSAGSEVHGKLFVVADGVPVTRAAIVEAACASRVFAGSPVPVFQAASGGPGLGVGGTGKVLDARRARRELQWAPRHISFPQFMARL